MATASLTGLPLELLVHLIATYLPTEDLGALRLTNKYLEKVLFDTFAREFFTKRQFKLSTSSLQTLVDISRHGALNKTLKHVIIGMESFQSFQDADPGFWNLNDSQRRVFHVGFADQFSLMSSGHDRTLLEEAFRNLPNLDTVGIRDYSAHGRVRDDGRWSSYGAPTISRQLGYDLRIYSNEFASCVFQLVMQALADADRAIPSIESILRGQLAGLTDLAFYLRSPDRKIDAVLGGLEQLLLTLHFTSSLRGSLNLDLMHLGSFLLRTPSLKHLRLNFQKSQTSTTCTILQHLATTPNLLPSLQRLDLGMMSTLPDMLLQIMSKFSVTLQHVSLWKTELGCDSSIRWKVSEDRYNPWPRLLRDISTTSHLTRLTLGCLGQHSEHGDPIRVKFKDGKISHEYFGDVKAYIPQVIDQLVVSWPQRPAGDSDSTSDGESADAEDGFTDEDDDMDGDGNEDYAD
ncbi:uncharacterized protein N0V89_008655 [Didymosphaeria variabile]|uniref:F-box domain-containing protein n=1 Tax=Didymosphaeria variabile TaxID=1932322 RepID=A0A9W8XG57_9PLEO|nr:uncharacterized protein N0V89_008655 [Didymosphaeria variabile]KAJ4350034.1 hypothetical protein N0V89_008655 [Didymosphaeria variabile]